MQNDELGRKSNATLSFFSHSSDLLSVMAFVVETMSIKIVCHQIHFQLAKLRRSFVHFPKKIITKL